MFGMYNCLLWIRLRDDYSVYIKLVEGGSPGLNAGDRVSIKGVVKNT